MATWTKVWKVALSVFMPEDQEMNHGSICTRANRSSKTTLITTPLNSWGMLDRQQKRWLWSWDTNPSGLCEITPNIAHEGNVDSWSHVQHKNSSLIFEEKPHIVVQATECLKGRQVGNAEHNRWRAPYANQDDAELHQRLCLKICSTYRLDARGDTIVAPPSRLMKHRWNTTP